MGMGWLIVVALWARAQFVADHCQPLGVLRAGAPYALYQNGNGYSLRDLHDIDLHGLSWCESDKTLRRADGSIFSPPRVMANDVPVARVNPAEVTCPRGFVEVLPRVKPTVLKCVSAR